MEAALKDIFAPVLQGIISSFLGFSGMAFSAYDYGTSRARHRRRGFCDIFN